MVFKLFVGRIPPFRLPLWGTMNFRGFDPQAVYRASCPALLRLLRLLLLSPRGWAAPFFLLRPMR